MQFGIGILTKRICYYPILLVNRYFLTNDTIRPSLQYGFQRNVSTSHALADVVTQSFENVNNNMYTGLIFLDLTKAFDTVNHEILLHKLDHYGIRGQSNNLLRAFLKRKQYVSINGSNSSLLTNDQRYILTLF